MAFVPASSSAILIAIARWWGELSGPEAVKNARAVDVVNKILREAVWINVHTLPVRRRRGARGGDRC